MSHDLEECKENEDIYLPDVPHKDTHMHTENTTRPRRDLTSEANVRQHTINCAAMKRSV